ncbi:MAG TPA: NAD(P)/FAD-dependent oxidoreductase [Fimbriimonas sp.]|nr:NAD(P)/FAD-dependent oxidoreductase [Fimbriimonas sp.]
MQAKKRIVVLGGGFGGAYALQKFGKKLGQLGGEAVLIDRNNYLLFDPLLIEAGVGAIEARHVVIPTRKFLQGQGFLMAEVLGVDLKAQTVTYRIEGHSTVETLPYDHLVIGLGSITKTPSVAGLLEHGFEMKTLGDAIGLRDRGIRLLELANTLTDSEKRRELLTCIVVGANYTGVELAGEYHAFLREAAHAYPNVRPDEIRMFLLEYADRILPAMSAKLARWCSDTLTERGVNIQLKTSLKEVAPDHAVTTAGEYIRTRTCVWAAGIAPNPLLVKIEGLPLNSHGYIDCEPDLRVKGFHNVWAVGDSATVMGADGKPVPATAQTASREGPRVAENIMALFEGNPTKPFEHKPLGSFAAIGRRQAAANVFGLDITGFLGWILYRGAYLVKMPSLGMKLRLLADWTTEMVFRNEPVQLGLRRGNRSGQSLSPEFEQVAVQEAPTIYAK